MKRRKRLEPGPNGSYTRGGSRDNSLVFRSLPPRAAKRGSLSDVNRAACRSPQASALSPRGHPIPVYRLRRNAGQTKISSPAKQENAPAHVNHIWLSVLTTERLASEQTRNSTSPMVKQSEPRNRRSIGLWCRISMIGCASRTACPVGRMIVASALNSPSCLNSKPLPRKTEEAACPGHTSFFRA